MYSIGIIGAGYTGFRIAQYFTSKNQKVFALTRSAEKARNFETQKIQPVLGDLTKPETLRNIPPAHFIVLAPAPDGKSESDYRDIYLKGIANFFEAIKNNPKPFLVVFFSSTSVYGEHQGEWVDEDTLLNPQTEKARILVEAERQVLKFNWPATIFRLAGIYGPERNRLDAFRQGRVETPKENACLNLIHVDDIVGAIPKIFNSAETGAVYLGCDDYPTTQFEIYTWLMSEISKTCPTLPKSDRISGKRCRNDKLKSLGYQFKYPSFKEGYREFIKNEKMVF